jgi:hypothetical protein
MARFNQFNDLRAAEFIGADLRGARFIESDLTGIVMRGVEIPDADIEAPWLFEAQSFLINGVNVIPFVEAELDRRFPGRAERRARDPEGLRAAWAKIERTWAATLERVAAMPPGTVDVSVGGEWSFAQTLRHLVFATDLWLGQSVLDLEQPIHAIGLAHVVPEHVVPEGEGSESIGSAAAPSFDEVLTVRADRIAMVREYLATIAPDMLASVRPNPHDAERQETVLSCLHTILEEEWEHHRFAVRDLDAIATSPG